MCIPARPSLCRIFRHSAPPRDRPSTGRPVHPRVPGPQQSEFSHRAELYARQLFEPRLSPPTRVITPATFRIRGHSAGSPSSPVCDSSSKPASGNTEKYTFAHNWAPRLGIIVDPFNDRKTKVFASVGRFFEKIPQDIAVRSLSIETSLTGALYEIRARARSRICRPAITSLAETSRSKARRRMRSQSRAELPRSIRMKSRQVMSTSSLII